jgi:hypothetical protein
LSAVSDTDDNAADFFLLTVLSVGTRNDPLVVCGRSPDSDLLRRRRPANPASVLPGGADTLSVTVTPGTNPTSTGLSVAATSP